MKWLFITKRRIRINHGIWLFFHVFPFFVIYFGQFSIAIVQFGIQILIWAMFLSKDLPETLDIISKYIDETIMKNVPDE